MKKFVLLIILLDLTFHGLYSQEITNIHFEQEGEMINIYYDLTGVGSFEIKVYCSQEEGKTWGQPLSMVTGAVGNDQGSGYGKKIVWDVLSEREKLQGDIKFKIEAIYRSLIGTFVDDRDGKTYKWVKIGDQVWMAENLNFITASGSWCYDNQTSNCITYGRLYDWQTAKTSCTAGWHLPSDIEWIVLTTYLGGDSIAGGKMKETGTSHWNAPNTGANNSSSFTVLPGGCRYADDGYFFYMGNGSIFWSSSEYDTLGSWLREFSYVTDGLSRGLNVKNFGFSVRCIKD
jgi:uncharacterized protein (TIGR02145 family)